MPDGIVLMEMLGVPLDTHAEGVVLRLDALCGPVAAAVRVDPAEQPIAPESGLSGVSENSWLFRLCPREKHT